MDFSRTLIIKPSSMGDIVQALPVLTALREAHPEAHVAWLVARPFAGLLEGHPRLNELILFDRHRFGQLATSVGATGDFLKFLEDLRRRKFTLTIDLQGLFRSGFLSSVTGAPDRVGFKAAREMAGLFYTLKVSTLGEVHAVDRYMAMARALGLAEPKATDHLPVHEEARAAVRRRLAEEGVDAGEPVLVVSAHARWETKQWPADRFAQVIALAHAKLGARAVLVGSGAAADLSRQVIQAATAARPVDWVNRTSLAELVALIADARAMVTNDSGPMHVAAAVNTPVVAIFGPTHPDRTGPYGPGHRVISQQAACSPCFRRQCLFANGPQALCCMKNVAAEEVARHLFEVWKAKR
jgi:lipopolysaccharide heptosyltransferase I